jgi:hypothetical protein
MPETFAPKIQTTKVIATLESRTDYAPAAEVWPRTNRNGNCQTGPRPSVKAIASIGEKTHMTIARAKMKKLLLASVAALLMATSAAHAFPSYKKCGEVFVRARIGGHSGADGNRYWTWEWYFEKKPPFNFKCNNKEIAG